MINMVLVWYDRNQANGYPIYSEMHMVSVDGETPHECMEKMFDLESKHDLDKFTRMHIAGIY